MTVKHQKVSVFNRKFYDLGIDLVLLPELFDEDDHQHHAEASSCFVVENNKKENNYFIGGNRSDHDNQIASSIILKNCPAASPLLNFLAQKTMDHQEQGQQRKNVNTNNDSVFMNNATPISSTRSSTATSQHQKRQFVVEEEEEMVELKLEDLLFSTNINVTSTHSAPAAMIKKCNNDDVSFTDMTITKMTTMTATMLDDSMDSFSTDFMLPQEKLNGYDSSRSKQNYSNNDNNKSQYGDGDTIFHSDIGGQELSFHHQEHDEYPHIPSTLSCLKKNDRHLFEEQIPPSSIRHLELNNEDEQDFFFFQSPTGSPAPVKQSSSTGQLSTMMPSMTTAAAATTTKNMNKNFTATTTSTTTTPTRSSSRTNHITGLSRSASGGSSTSTGGKTSSIQKKKKTKARSYIFSGISRPLTTASRKNMIDGPSRKVKLLRKGPDQKLVESGGTHFE